MKTTKKSTYLCRLAMKKNCNLFIGLLLAVTSLMAQPALAQNPATVKAAEFTDAQILDLLSQAQAAGLGVEQAEKLAIAKGMPASEAQAFKDRVNKIQANAPVAAASPGTAIKEATDAKAKQALVEAATPITGSEIVAPKADKPVTVYGQELFRKGDIKIYERSIDAKAPANYELGVGDELGISIFGVSYYNTVAKVDSRGRIELGQLGSIYVKGVPFDKAKVLIKTALSNNFNMSSNQVEISLAYSRSITVNIVGEVFKPGSYKIPALNTAFNALIAAGGPTDIGTLRNIQLRRNGKVIKTFDVYAYLQNPGSDDDFFLQDNDYLVIGTVGKLVSIAGAVKRPMTYELLPNEELTQLIKYTGGLNANAMASRSQVQRYISKNQRLLPVNLDSLAQLKLDFALQNGDAVTIGRVNDDLENRVEVKGPVYFPGVFPIVLGDRVSDLILKAGGLREQILLKRAYLVRTEKDETRKYIPLNVETLVRNSSDEGNVVLQKNDVLLLYSEAEFLDKFTVNINGEVKNPVTLAYKEGLTLGDVLVLAGGIKISAELTKIEISRSNIFAPNYKPGEPYQTSTISLTIPKEITENQEVLKMQLLPFDIVSVRRIPNFEFQKTVELKGEFQYPGIYVIQDKGFTVNDVVKLAGGLTPFAFAEGAKFDRPNLPGGFLVFDMKKAMQRRGSMFNYTLKEGDIITVPKVIDYVSIYGSGIQYIENLITLDTLTDYAVMNSPFVGGKRAGYYIRTFGNGYTSDAWRAKTYVVEANGRVRRTVNLYAFRVSPKVKKGSSIYVISKEKKAKTTFKDRVNKIPTDWNKVISDITIKLTGFATLWALIQK
jgi:protein involved in polysaccharide export with SLBB domain